MKLRLVLFALALAACKGKSSTTTAQQPPTPCASMAVHVTDVVRKDMGEALADEDWPKVSAVLEERCSKDAWAAETIACMQAAVQGPDFDACADKLPDEQEAAVKAQFEQTIKPLIREDAMQRKGSGEKDDAMEGGGGGGGPTTGSAPPPPPDDPCGGDD